MIRKPIKGGKLLTFTALNLLLLATAIANSIDENSLVESEVKPFAEYDIRPSRDYEAGVRYDANIMNDDNIAAIYHVYNSSLTEARVGEAIGSWIKIIGPESELIDSRIRSECFVPFKRATTSPIKRLSHETVLYEAYAVNEDGQKRMKLISVNMNNCKYTEVYNGTLPSENHFIYTSNNASDQSFTVVVNDKKFCRDHDWCRLFFNPFYHKFEPLNFDFSSHEVLKMEPATSFDGNLFVVHLLDVTYTYKIRLYNIIDNSTTSDYKELLSLPNYKFGIVESFEMYQVISSSLSFCWRTNQRTDEDKITHCSAFRKDGTLVFNKTIVHADVEEFLYAQSIPNGLMLISATTECVRKNCSTVEVAVIRSNFECNNGDNNCSGLHSTSSSLGNELMDIEHRQYNFVCGPLLFTSVYYRVNVSGGSIEVDHMCIGFGHSFLNNLFSIGQAILLRDSKRLN